VVNGQKLEPIRYVMVLHTILLILFHRKTIFKMLGGGGRPTDATPPLATGVGQWKKVILDNIKRENEENGGKEKVMQCCQPIQLKT